MSKPRSELQAYLIGHCKTQKEIILCTALSRMRYSCSLVTIYFLKGIFDPGTIFH